jgi:hypothetical protein
VRALSVTMRKTDLIDNQYFVVYVHRQVVRLHNDIIFWVEMCWKSHLSYGGWILFIFLDLLLYLLDQLILVLETRL